jgi:two-component system sensor histidine kinase SenX3
VDGPLVVAAAAAGLVIGAAVGAVLNRRVAARHATGGPGWTRAGGRFPARGGAGPDERLAGLARKSVDALRVGVLVLDGNDRPVLVNTAARSLGLLRAGAPGAGPDAHPTVRTLADQVRRTGVRREVDLDLPRGADGSAAGAPAVGVQLRAVSLGGGHVAVEAADVTESHRVARVRRDFVANVSHELKTPIGALQLLSEALLDATGEAGRVGSGDGDLGAARRFADRIHRESERLGRLVTELIELSRLQGADPLPALEPVSVDWLVADVLDRTRTAATAKGIDVGVAGTRGLTVYGSDLQLATALANLVENAVAYSAEGSRVTVHTGGDGQTITVAVIDQGMGIAPDELDRVFERFYRADRARSRATGGTGLGLAIVKQIATNHGGRVEVASRVGEGSTFTLRLPARLPEDSAAGSLAAPAGTAPRRGTG